METLSELRNPEAVKVLHRFCQDTCAMLESNCTVLRPVVLKDMIRASASRIFGESGFRYNTGSLTSANSGTHSFSVDFVFDGTPTFSDFTRDNLFSYFLDAGNHLQLSSTEDLKAAKKEMLQEIALLVEESAYKQDKFAAVKDLAQYLGFMATAQNRFIWKNFSGHCYYDLSVHIDIGDNLVRFLRIPKEGNRWRDVDVTNVVIERFAFTKSQVAARLRKLGVDDVNLERVEVDFATMKQIETMDTSILEIAEVF